MTMTQDIWWARRDAREMLRIAIRVANAEGRMLNMLNLCSAANIEHRAKRWRRAEGTAASYEGPATVRTSQKR